MVPEGWERTRLGSLVNIASGIAPSSLHLKQVGKYPYVKVEDMNNCSKYQVDSRTFTDDELKAIPKGSVIFPKRGAAIMNNKVRIAAKDIYLDSNMMSLYPKDGLITEYLYYCLVREELHRIADTSTIPQINNKHITPYIFLLPPLPEQKKIAQILSTWDKAITTTEKLLKNSQQQKKALMQQLLTGKKRLKGFSGEFKRFHFSQLIKIDKQNLGSKTKPDFAFDYISLSDVSPGAISRSLEKYSFKDAPSRARRIVQDGDILLATVRPNLQGFARVRKVNDGAIASTGFAVLTPKSNVCGDYVYHYLFGAHITGQINALVVGTNYPAINSSDVAGLCIYCPCYEEQKEIAEVLNNCDSTTQSLNNKLEKLKQEKKALMQQLLTGKRRVQV